MELSGLRNEALSAWIAFDGDTEVLLGYVSREDLREVRGQATAVRFAHHQRLEEIDRKEADRLLGRKAVRGWRPSPGRPGFTMNGAPFTYSPENCDLLMERFNEFADFVNEKAIGFANFVEHEKAEEIGK